MRSQIYSAEFLVIPRVHVRYAADGHHPYTVLNRPTPTVATKELNVQGKLIQQLNLCLTMKRSTYGMLGGQRKIIVCNRDNGPRGSLDLANLSSNRGSEGV